MLRKYRCTNCGVRLALLCYVSFLFVHVERCACILRRGCVVTNVCGKRAPHNFARPIGFQTHHCRVWVAQLARRQHTSNVELPSHAFVMSWRGVRGGQCLVRPALYLWRWCSDTVCAQSYKHTVCACYMFSDPLCPVWFGVRKELFHGVCKCKLCSSVLLCCC